MIEPTTAEHTYLRIGESVAVGTVRLVLDQAWASGDWWSGDWLGAVEVYEAAILGTPDVTTSLENAWYGFTEVATLRVRLRNEEGQYDALWDARGQAVIAFTYDEQEQRYERFRGVVSKVNLEPGDTSRVPAVVVEAMNQDLSAFNAMVPARVLSTTLFGASCRDVGAAIPKVIGHVEKLPLPYATDDVPGATFYHPVSEGPVTVTAVYRDTIHADQYQPLTPGEYSVLLLPNGTTVVRTYIRQLKGGGGGFHKLFADVQGPAAERNLARAYEAIAGNATWGAGLTMDAGSIATAAALVPASLVVDGALTEQRPVREYLDELLMLRGGRPVYDPASGWGLIVDSLATASQLTVGDGPGVTIRNLLVPGVRATSGIDEDVATLTVQYAPNLAKGEGFLYETSARAVSPVGKPKALPHRFLRDATAADVFACYHALRMRAAADRVDGSEITRSGRALREGDIINYECPPLQLYGVDRQIIAIQHLPSRVRLTHVAWDAGIYTYAAGTLPPVQALDNTATPPAPTGFAVTASGAAPNLEGGVSGWVEVEVVIPAAPGISSTRIDYRVTGTTTYGNAQSVTGTGAIRVAIGNLASGITYDLRAVNLNGALVSSALTIPAWVAPGDTTAPGAAGTPTLISQSLKTASFSWTAPADLDVRGYNWQLHDASGGGGTLIQSGFTASRTREIVGPSYATYHFRVQPVDYSGNVGAFTASAPVTLVTAVTGDIGTGQVQSGNIGTGQVGTVQIADGAVTQGSSVGAGSLLTMGAAYTTLRSLSFTARGGIVQLVASVAGALNTGVAAGDAVLVRVREGGVMSPEEVLVATPVVPAASLVGSRTISFYVSPSVGGHTWIVEAIRAGSGTGTAQAQVLGFGFIEWTR